MVSGDEMTIDDYRLESTMVDWGNHPTKITEGAPPCRGFAKQREVVLFRVRSG